MMEKFLGLVRSTLKLEVQRERDNLGDVRGVWTTAPWVKVLLDFPELEKKWNVWFLVDTGAMVSVLSSSDAEAIGLYKLTSGKPTSDILWASD